MKINYAKSIIIFLLVLLTFVQTVELWFGGSSNGNLLYSFFDSGTNRTDAANISIITKPYRIITGNNSDKFTIKYSNIETPGVSGTKKSKQKEQMDYIIEALFKTGEFAESKELDWVQILRNQIMLAEYKFQMPVETFNACYNQKSNSLLSKFNSFDNIAFIPSADGTVSVIFINSIQGVCFEYKLKTGDNNAAMLAAIQTMTVSDENIYYISSAIGGIDVFGSNVFIPRWENGGLFYHSINSQNPYSENGEITYSTIGKKIDVFFENPASKIANNPNDIYSFSDENTVIKYYPDGFLEYNNFKTVDEKFNGTFLSAFSAAIGFIETDPAVTEDYYLADYSNNDETWVFYFDFSINDYPVLLSQNLDISHAIEITVKSDLVTKYRHYAYAFETAEPSRSNPSSDLFKSIESEAESSYYDAESIHELTLVYRIRVEDSQISLCWKMNIDGIIFLRSAS